MLYRWIFLPDPGIHCCLYLFQLAKLLISQSLKRVLIPSTFVNLTHTQIRFPMFLHHNQKRERKVPTLGNFNVGTKAHIGRASLSQLPIVVTQTPRQDGTPKLGGVNPPPNTWLLGWRLGEQAEARW